MTETAIREKPQAERPAWFRGPGECFDSKGVPIYPGDLVRSYHFTGPRRRVFYLYHVVCEETCDVTGHSYLRLVPTAFLNPTTKDGGGRCMLSDRLAEELEVIDGHEGPGLGFTGRPKRRPSKPSQCERA